MLFTGLFELLSVVTLQQFTEYRAKYLSYYFFHNGGRTFYIFKKHKKFGINFFSIEFVRSYLAIKMIKLYTSPTPNGYKISCLLEMLKMPYEFELVDLSQNEQFSEKFKKISPNSKIPAIEDSDNNIALSESGAIMIYLAEKGGKFLQMKA